MTLKDWRENAKDHINERGLFEGAKKASYEFYQGMFRQVGKRFNYGRYIYEYEWDLLIVLDACRADLMAEVANEFEFASTNSAFSCASSSGEWHLKNFSEEYSSEKSKTALISANPYTKMHIEEDNFYSIDEVWRDCFDENIGTVMAERVVDRTIIESRSSNPPRMIAHFMQPHYPFVPDPIDEGIAMGHDHTPWDTVWDQLKKGDISKQEAWAGYRENLRYVLNNVTKLLNNINAEKVIITADHGNLLGEFGLYAHPQYVPLPALKRVPWIVTSATDGGTHEPKKQEETSVSREDQLRALGYK